MNKEVLNTGIQHFINKNLDTDIVSVLLKKSPFEGISPQQLAQQIESKKKCKNKLPTWFRTPKIYYPKKLSVEQASSEVTANYKAEITGGKSLLDLAGGFGVDTYFFSRKIEKVLYCEIVKELSEIAAYNFKLLNALNIKVHNADGITFLQHSDTNFSWIYIDPSRRNNGKIKAFKLADCLPNIPQHLALLLARSENMLIKTSPLLDLSIGLRELRFVREIHVVAVDNEVKELLWVLREGGSEEVHIKTINLGTSGDETFDFYFAEEKKAVSSFAEPLEYLFEPNAAIMKSGAFKSIGNLFSLQKLHEHTHLYTSDELIEFPGRRFKIIQNLPYNKKLIKAMAIAKANITTRNFPESVAAIRKKFKIGEGGREYLFFFTDIHDAFRVVRCIKAP